MVPGNAGVCRDIRANMERTSLPEGLDHHGPEVRAMVGKGIDTVDEIHVSRARSPAEAPSRSVIRAGSGPDLAWSADRLAADRSFYSGKHRRPGMNLQVIASPDGPSRGCPTPCPAPCTI